jgi:hypothetical protein
MTVCRGGDSRLLCSPSGGHAGEREVGTVDQRRSARLGGGRRRPWREAHGNSVMRVLQGGGALYSRKGVHLTPSPRHLG